MKTHYLPLLIILISFQSCIEKELEREIPFEGQRLVIEGFISPNQSVELKVYRTLPPVGELEIDEKYIATATVKLFEDNIFIENLTYRQDGLYQSPSAYKPKFGKAYHVEVTAPDFPKAVSKPEVLPDSVPTFNWSFIDSIEVNSGQIKGKLDFSFSDIQAQPNFYEILIEGLPNNSIQSVGAYFQKDFYLENPFCNVYNNGSGELLSDLCFEDATLSYSFDIDTRLQEPNNLMAKYDQLRIRLSTVHESLFNYSKFLTENSWADNDPFYEAGLYYTNIEGGYGVFTTYLDREILIDL